MPTKTDRPTLTGARWSNATRCPRMAAYDVLRALPAPPSDRVERLWRRGHDVEDAWFNQLSLSYSGRVEREAAIPWGIGWELHCDGVLVDETDRPHIEVKSTVDVDKLPGIPITIDGMETTSAVLQVAGAALFDLEGGTAEIVTVSPVDYYERRWPIALTDALAAAVEETEARVVRAAEGGELPARCCSKPTDAIGRFCPYKDTCFADWEEPEPVTLDDERAFSLVDLLLTWETDARKARAHAYEVEQARNVTRAEVKDALGLEPGTEYEVGTTRVRISQVKGRETFAYRDAISAGHLTLTDTLTPYLKHGQPSQRWTVEPLEAPDEA